MIINVMRVMTNKEPLGKRNKIKGQQYQNGVIENHLAWLLNSSIWKANLSEGPDLIFLSIIFKKISKPKLAIEVHK